MKKLITILLGIILISPALVQAQGCMEPTSDDGISVIGFIQPEFSYDFSGQGKEGFDAPKDYNSFSFRRARLGVTGVIPYDISYYVMAEFSSFMGGPYLLDAHITYNRFAPWINVTMGQLKAPFGLELLTPCHKLHTIQRSRVVNEMAHPFRDIGIVLWGGTDSLQFFGLTNHNIISYKLAIMNGPGMNEWDNNSSKDIIARLVISPWKFIRLGGSYRYGKQAPAQPDLDEDVRTRWGGDIELEFGDFLFQAEYIWGEDKGSTLEGGGCGGDPILILGNFVKTGYFAQAMYMTPWRLQPIVKYESYDPADDVSDDLYTTVTIGLNYWINDWTRLQANYLINDNQKNAEYYQGQFMFQAQVNF
jgi:phosphate-selective porin